MKVKKLTSTPANANLVPSLLDKEGIAFQPINHVNWSEFPYCPEVAFRIAYTDSCILLHFKVKEESVRAVYGKDNGSVWTDSCVEFFSVPGGDDIYYNIECNCIGTILIGAGAERENRVRANEDITHLVQRWSTLGNQPFEEKVEGIAWEVALMIPYQAFFLHQITSLEGKTIPANFYKCGDELKTPHFLSWNPIPIAKPDFHRPDHFGSLEFVGE